MGKFNVSLNETLSEADSAHIAIPFDYYLKQKQSKSDYLVKDYIIAAKLPIIGNAKKEDRKRLIKTSKLLQLTCIAAPLNTFITLLQF
ncbi:MAG TPA: hypothetical protein VHA52_03390 [Candidatus Babeliaceae bacterium]|nr:hypothetical protein [Candidatus Babeliaceae bacterium]